MAEQSWPGEWLRGVLNLCVLAVVAEAGSDGTYGYAVAQRLHDDGLGTVKGGTLYPILNRLEQDGLVRTRWVEGDKGPGRKTFTITGDGREQLRARGSDWRVFAARASELIDAALTGTATEATEATKATANSRPGSSR